MTPTIQLSVTPAEAADDRLLRKAIARTSNIPVSKISGWQILRKSIDARSRQPKVLLTIQLHRKGELVLPQLLAPKWQQCEKKEEVLIIGAGPAGLFAALKCLELGYRPVILERGKDVRSRRRDLAALNKEGVVNPDSNYCFGEGGAGTYSDGKLYTRSTKRGDIQRILQLFHYFGAHENVLYEAHPHIGTNKLPHIITAMRDCIVELGGIVAFNTRVTDLMLTDGKIAGVKANGISWKAAAVILATGHSARDIFELLERKEILIHAKPFALGVRIEHPQHIVDSAQYHSEVRDPNLPPASYSLVTQENGRGVFSFCMCPGGIIAPAATAAGEIVVNGWSPSKRNNPYANSGTVVTVDEADFAPFGFRGPLAAMHYQAMVEQTAFKVGGGKLVAPAQRLADFTEGHVSATLPDCSYQPGLLSCNLSDVLPAPVDAALKKAVVTFGRKMKGYFTNEAVVVATESRTSSPVRIPRDADTLMHPQVDGLFPCAEGAGYAGGIVSAAMDGERCATMAVQYLKTGKEG